MLKQLGFVLDVNRCLGCGACVKACQLQNYLPVQFVRRSIRKVEDHTPEGIRRFYLSSACNHCANPECLRICPTGAYAKRRDGIVIHNPKKCTGCKSCTTACPFGAPKIHPQSGKASKCQLCYERIDRECLPHCVTVCITGALRLEEIQVIELSGLLRLTAPLPSLRLTKPSVFYHSPRRIRLKLPVKD